MAARSGAQHLNVFKQPLAFFSREPVTGFYRDGYCRVGPDDGGNHAVAGELTKEFLEFTESRGNPLQSMAGLTPGCKWCLCASRWKEAWSARRSDDDPIVPRVNLNATHESALRNIDLADLQKFATDRPVTNGASGGHREL